MIRVVTPAETVIDVERGTIEAVEVAGAVEAGAVEEDPPITVTRIVIV